MKKIAYTLALNGMPYLKHQYKYIPKCFDKWYIIEGPAKNVHCTGWCKEIPKEYLNDVNMSNDGTYEFLTEIEKNNDKIVVIRPEEIDGVHRFWNGKIEMCNSFIDEIEDSILFEISVDEIWTEETVNDILNYCEQNSNNFTCMQFKCHFLVGQNLVLKGSNCYGDMPYEWNRLWIIKDKTRWVRHEPDELDRKEIILPKSFTSTRGWMFTHYAYVLEEQIRFKQDYYGYANLVNNWKRLQEEQNFPVPLRNYFPFVRDHSMVVKIDE